MNLEQIEALDGRYHMNVYGRQPVAFVRGEGAVLWDTDGKEYLDFLAGIAVMSVGHSHPKVVEAIREQAGTLTHVSNLFYTEPQAVLAERLHDLLGWGKVFFANSGAEANECALELAGDWAAEIVGKALARGLIVNNVTPNAVRLAPPLIVSDEQIEQAVGDETTAVLLEVVQGEGGVRLATPEYLTAARKFCDERGAALIFDEVQTGLGRTGKWFAFQHYDVAPHIVTLAKALGAGLPIGACIAREDVADAFKPGDHATTFGGGPVPCMAALAVLDVIESEGLVARAAEAGEQLADALARELAGDWAAEIVGKALARGLIVNNVTPNAVRLAPPLIVSDEQIEQAVEILVGILSGYGDAS